MQVFVTGPEVASLFPFPPRHLHPVRGVECAIEQFRHFHGFLQQHRVFPVGEIMGSQEATQIPNRRLEDIDVLVVGGRKVDLIERGHGLLELVFQAHDEQCVERVHQRGCPPGEGVDIAATNGSYLILQPCVFLVATPRVYKCLLHGRLPLLSPLSIGGALAREVILNPGDLGGLACWEGDEGGYGVLLRRPLPVDTVVVRWWLLDGHGGLGGNVAPMCGRRGVIQEEIDQNCEHACWDDQALAHKSHVGWRTIDGDRFTLLM